MQTIRSLSFILVLLIPNPLRDRFKLMRNKIEYRKNTRFHVAVSAASELNLTCQEGDRVSSGEIRLRKPTPQLHYGIAF